MLESASSTASPPFATRVATLRARYRARAQDLTRLQARVDGAALCALFVEDLELLVADGLSSSAGPTVAPNSAPVAAPIAAPVAAPIAAPTASPGDPPAAGPATPNTADALTSPAQRTAYRQQLATGAIAARTGVRPPRLKVASGPRGTYDAEADARLILGQLPTDGGAR